MQSRRPGKDFGPLDEAARQPGFARPDQLRAGHIRKAETRIGELVVVQTTDAVAHAADGEVELVESVERARALSVPAFGQALLRLRDPLVCLLHWNLGFVA